MDVDNQFYSQGQDKETEEQAKFKKAFKDQYDNIQRINDAEMKELPQIMKDIAKFGDEAKGFGNGLVED